MLSIRTDRARPRRHGPRRLRPPWHSRSAMAPPSEQPPAEEQICDPLPELRGAPTALRRLLRGE